MSKNGDTATFSVVDIGGGEIEVHLHRSSLDALADFKIDSRVILAKLDEFLRGTISGRCDLHDIDGMIAKQIERRIEVASRSVLSKLDTTAAAIASEMIRQRITDIVGALDIAVSITCTQRGSNDTHDGA